MRKRVADTFMTPDGVNQTPSGPEEDRGGRRIIVSEFVTLDGVMEAPGGEPGHPHTGWVFNFMSDEQLRYKLDEVREAEALLIGRVTYESFAGAWPQRSGEFADKMNSMPKHVVSSTLRNPTWNNSKVIGGDVAGEVARLKTQEGGPILVGGSRTLMHTLMEHDLVDEYRLMIFPVVLGSGRRLFPEKPQKSVLRLVAPARSARALPCLPIIRPLE